MTNLSTFIFVLSLLTIQWWHQPARVGKLHDLDNLAYTFKNGSSRELSNYFGSRVEINISGNSGHYSKNQAEQVMRDFFKKYPPLDFHLLQKSAGSNDLTATMAHYFSGEQRFKILIKAKSEKEGPLVFALDIIKE
ncbi:DUF4783 domain-containing protein [Mongoliitalea daihaiensis]|uniref:DUF4783 domain-containing protein n=1 Tax=Mongoliitalea daihaiensis TaxID=2782006 RepID=UPI001F36CF8F|nr:DUF4783 domain-containing protein [Mongoliitalea daihaiensis]UJP66522.1 DUF4783 domain-containing protein [Mongoliitalea daihaiensis]